MDRGWGRADRVPGSGAPGAWVGGRPTGHAGLAARGQGWAAGLRGGVGPLGPQVPRAQHFCTARAAGRSPAPDYRAATFRACGGGALRWVGAFTPAPLTPGHASSGQKPLPPDVWPAAST